MAGSHETSKKSTKRKSMGNGDASRSDIQVTVGESSTSVGPAFVNFPSIRPAKSIPFTIYSRDPSSSTGDITKQQTIIAGETEDVEYFSTNRDRPPSSTLTVEGADCQYLPALFDPSTQTLHVAPSAPLYLLAHRVKKQKYAALPSAVAATDWRKQRNDLGEVFGTKKAQSRIRAEERNRVDVSAMAGVKGHLMEAIGETIADGGPTLPSELIPVPNVNTAIQAEVYPLESLISPAEWASIDVSHILKAQDDRGRSGLLPYRRSRWLEDKLRVACQGPKEGRRQKVKMLYYLSALHAFNNSSAQLHKTSTSEMAGKLPGVSPQLLNGLITRFAESSGKKYTVTERMKTKLLAWICTVYLAVDNWSTEVGKVAKDLSMTPLKIGDIYKSLGCSVDAPSPAEREKMGVSAAEALKLKRAVLKAPVVYPKIKMRGPVKR
ncbi:DNA-directed RNA polymerase I subunit RPA49, partial [Tremellales sp. Uapishka_1]